MDGGNSGRQSGTAAHGRRRWRRAVLWLGLGVAVVAVGSVALPRAVEVGVQRAWRSAGIQVPLSFDVRTVRWGRIVLADVVVGDPSNAVLRARSAAVTFGGRGLLRKEVGEIALDGGWTLGQRSGSSWYFAAASLLPRSDPAATKSMPLTRLPFEALRVTDFKVELEEGGGAVRPRAVFDAMFRRNESGCVRVTAMASASSTDGHASVALDGVFDPLPTLGLGRVSVSGQANGDAVSGAVDVRWNQDDNGQLAFSFVNGVARVPHSLLRRWQPETMWSDGEDLQVSAVGGAFWRQPSAGSPVETAWFGGVEGHFAAGRQRVGIAQDRAVALEADGIVGRFGAEIEAGRVVRVVSETAVPAWSARAEAQAFAGSAILSTTSMWSGASSPLRTEASALVSLRPLGGAFAGLRLGDGDGLRLRLGATSCDGSGDYSVELEPDTQAFAWQSGGWSVAGSVALRARGFGESGERGGGCPAGLLAGGASCTLMDVRIVGMLGTNAATVRLDSVAADAEFSCSPDDQALGAHLHTAFGLVVPPFINIAGSSEQRLQWSSSNGLSIASANLRSYPFDVVGLGSASLDEFGIGVSNGVPVSANIAILLERSEAKPKLTARRGLGTSGDGWGVEFEVPPFALGASDGVQGLMKRYLPVPGVSVTGRFGGVVAVRGRPGGTPTTTVKVTATNGVVQAEGWKVEGVQGEADLVLRQERLRTSGEQDWRFGRAVIGGFEVDGGRVSWGLEPGLLRVGKAEVDWLGGKLHAYALSFDLNSHNADFVLYVDNVDVGRLLRLVKPLAGSGEGRVFGRVPVQWVDGRLRLSSAYLYSMPGQTGSIRLSDPGPLVALLAQAGVAAKVQDVLAEALRDFSFTTLALELHPPAADGETLLAVRLAGVSRDPEQPTPVDATLNLRGPLETLLNMGVLFGSSVQEESH